MGLLVQETQGCLSALSQTNNTIVYSSSNGDFRAKLLYDVQFTAWLIAKILLSRLAQLLHE